MCFPSRPGTVTQHESIYCGARRSTWRIMTALLHTMADPIGGPARSSRGRDDDDGAPARGPCEPHQGCPGTDGEHGQSWSPSSSTPQFRTQRGFRRLPLHARRGSGGGGVSEEPMRCSRRVQPPCIRPAHRRPLWSRAKPRRSWRGASSGSLHGDADRCRETAEPDLSPKVAFFGEKDYQQLTLIKQMVADLNMPCESSVSPPPGRATASAVQPQRLSEFWQRRTASAIPRALAAAVRAAESGARADGVLAAARGTLRGGPGPPSVACP